MIAKCAFLQNRVNLDRFCKVKNGIKIAIAGCNEELFSNDDIDFLIVREYLVAFLRMPQRGKVQYEIQIFLIFVDAGVERWHEELFGDDRMDVEFFHDLEDILFCWIDEIYPGDFFYFLSRDHISYSILMCVETTNVHMCILCLPEQAEFAIMA